jgi:hypothetical protein
MRGIAIALAMAGAMACGAATAEAREGFYLGAGFAGASGTGGFDGTSFQTDSSSNKYLFGTLGSGTGLSLDLGYNFTKYFGIEYFSTSTLHTVSYSSQADSAAAVGLGLLGVRFTAPLAKSFELFLRLGTAAAIVDVEAGALAGGTVPSAVEYSGDASGYGVGFEILGDHIGVGFGYTLFAASFDEAKINGQSTFMLTKHVNENFAVTDVTIAYHFGSN